ncbi:MAG: hypothetical protein H6833_07050 [Planctomycetes bacterium]|nr:hypothetical protein [Planctomycetota bacterium]
MAHWIGWGLFGLATVIALGSIPMALLMMAFASDAPSTPPWIPWAIGGGFLVFGFAVAFWIGRWGWRLL